MRFIIAAATAFALIAGMALGFAVSQGLDGSASAAPPPPADTKVREQNLDGSGLIRVHEQGTANVNVTNTSVPVSGTVDVGNLPLDAQGNVRVSEAPQSAQLDFTHLLVDVCTSSSTDFCVPAGPCCVDVDAALANFSQQGWRLVEVEFITAGSGGGRVLYTLSRPSP